MKIKQLAASLAFMILVVMSFYIFSFNQEITAVGFDELSDKATIPISNIILTIVALLLGVVFGSIHEEISLHNETEKLPKGFVGGALSKPNTIRAFLAAPIVYAGVYTIAQEQPDVVVAFLFAFQNGFFCNTIMKTKKEKQE